MFDVFDQSLTSLWFCVFMTLWRGPSPHQVNLLPLKSDRDTDKSSKSTFDPSK
jgi:hypothetical protein